MGSALHVVEGLAALPWGPRVWPCWKAVADEHDQFTYDDWFTNYFANEAALEGHRLVVATDGESVVGYAWNYVGHLGQADVDRTAAALDPAVARRWLGDHVDVSDMGVRIDHRGRGLGAALHDELLRDSRRKAVMVTWAMGDLDYNFFRRLGWTKIGQKLPGLHILGREASNASDPEDAPGARPTVAP